MITASGVWQKETPTIEEVGSDRPDDHAEPQLSYGAGVLGGDLVITYDWGRIGIINLDDMTWKRAFELPNNNDMRLGDVGGGFAPEQLSR